MKKYLYLLLVIIITNTLIIKISATTNTVNYRYNKQNNNIEEELLKINDNEITIKLTIKENNNDNNIIINPNLFEIINHYRLLNKDKNIKINLIINNLSNNTYKYKKDSLYIENYTNNNQILYKSYNKPIKKLIKTKPTFLTNTKLNEILDNNKYKNIVDYYKKYYKVNDLSKLDNNNIKEIFSGEKINVEENNKELVLLGNKYFNDNIIKIKIDNNIYTLNEIMNYYIDDSYLLNREFSNSSQLIELDLIITNDYKEIFKNMLVGHIEFILEKENT